MQNARLRKVDKRGLLLKAKRNGDKVYAGLGMVLKYYPKPRASAQGEMEVEDVNGETFKVEIEHFMSNSINID